MKKEKIKKIKFDKPNAKDGFMWGLFTAGSFAFLVVYFYVLLK